MELNEQAKIEAEEAAALEAAELAAEEERAALEAAAVATQTNALGVTLTMDSFIA